MRVFGLDISKDAVACVEIEASFGRFEIRETYEIPLSADPEIPADPFYSAQTLLQSIGGKPGRLVTSAPTEITTFRNLHMATRDKKAIRAGLAFELEDDLPFEAENLHYDFANFNTPGPGSDLHVGAVRKDSFETHLRQLLTNGIDPDVITTDTWAYRSLFTRMNVAPEGSLLMGFERHKIFFYVTVENRPILYREIPFGIATLEQKLSENLAANQEELRTWIQDIGVTGINEEVSNEISEILESLIPEIKQIELAARSQQAQIKQIHLTGEGALMPGLLAWLEAATDRPVTLFRPMSELTGARVNYSDLSEIRFSKALALAMTQVPQDKIPALNLRKGPFARAGTTVDSPLERMKKPLPYLLTIAAVFMVTKSIEYWHYKQKLAETDDSLKRVVKNYYGGTLADSAVRVHLASPSKLKSEIQNDLIKERELSKLFAPNANSPLDLLRSLSEKIQSSIVVDMTTFDAGSDNTDRFVDGKPLRTTLSFVVTNAQNIAKLTEVLEKNFGFRASPTESVVRDGHKAFKVSYTGSVGAKK